MKRHKNPKRSSPKIALIALLFVLTPIQLSQATVAASPFSVAGTAICPATPPNNSHCGLPDVSANSNTIKNILKIAFSIIGAFALLSMTASGLKYITSAGDPQKTSEAKKGIIFSLVGLALAVTAEAIVAFVVNRGAP